MLEVVENHKHPIIVFIIIFFIISLIAHFSFAQNPDKEKDTDNDGLTDYEEKAIYQTFWNNPDSDGDGYPDGNEVKNNYSPKQPGLKMYQADTDNDGLNDDWEIKLGTNLMIRDTDGDGYLDGTEVYYNYSPTNPNPVKVEKLIKVNIKNFSLKYYFDGILLDDILVSTGKPSTPTPTGEFTITNKYPFKNYYGYPNTKWNLQFHTSYHGLRYYIHGAYWHNLFGEKNVSGGCVNVPYEHMERIYNMTSEGTKVIIE